MFSDMSLMVKNKQIVLITLESAIIPAPDFINRYLTHFGLHLREWHEDISGSGLVL